MRFINKLSGRKKKIPSTGASDQLRIRQMYEKHNLTLRRYASRYLRTEGDISDAVQDIFTRVATMTNRENIYADPLPYLITMTRNIIMDGYRKGMVRERYKEGQLLEQKSIPLFAQTFVSEQTPERIVEGRQQLDLVVACVKQMPDDIQRAFLLSRIKNMTYKEIAIDMSLSERTVLRYVAQAISVIKSRLEQK